MASLSNGSPEMKLWVNLICELICVVFFVPQGTSDQGLLSRWRTFGRDGLGMNWFCGLSDSFLKHQPPFSLNVLSIYQSRMGSMALCWTEGRRHARLPHVVMKVKDFKRKMTGLWHLPVGWPGSAWLRGGWVYGQCPRLHARRPGAAGSNPCCQPRLWTPQTGAALVRLPWETDTSIHVQINISTDWRMDRGSRSRNLKSINICHISLENT